MSVIPVAKSTVSLWLQSVQLAKHQKQRITEKKLQSAKRGGAAKKKQRIERQQAAYATARREVGQLTKRERWLIGIALYWAEGTKEKENRPGAGASFTNSDPRMLRMYLAWLKDLQVGIDDLTISIYIHRSHESRTEEIRKYWATELTIPLDKLSKVYYKRHTPKTNRKNIGNAYHGQIVVKVKRSSGLARTIVGWIQGLTQ